MPESLPTNESCENSRAAEEQQRVAGSRVAQLLPCVLDVLKAEPGRSFSPSEVAHKLGAKSGSVKSILSRLAQTGKHGGPVIRIDYGQYQYSEEKSGRLSTILSRLGRVGIENLIYASLGTPTPGLQDHSSVDTDLRVAKPREGYPVFLPSGQEIRWEKWQNGSERVSFVSNGRPFSPDLILYLHEQLRRQGLAGDQWKRVSIEVNIDSERVTITPESATFQDTYGIIWKAYNHGMQVRFEVADRRGASLKDTLSILLGLSDSHYGKEALRQVGQLRKEVRGIAGDTRLALNISRKTRDKVDDHTGTRKKKKSPSVGCEWRQKGSKRVADENGPEPIIAQTSRYSGMTRAQLTTILMQTHSNPDEPDAFQQAWREAKEQTPAFRTGADILKEQAPAAGPGEHG